MATGLFASYTEGLMSAPASAPDLDTDTIAAALIPDTNPPDLTDDSTFVNVSNLVASIEDNSHRANLSSKTIGNLTGPAAHVFDAADTVFTSAAASANNMDLILYKVVTLDTDHVLIAYWDPGAGSVQPNGQNVTVQWSASGIFRLG